MVRVRHNAPHVPLLERFQFHPYGVGSSLASHSTLDHYTKSDPWTTKECYSQGRERKERVWALTVAAIAAMIRLAVEKGSVMYSVTQGGDCRPFLEP